MLDNAFLAGKIEHYAELFRKVIDRSKRRILKGEMIHAEEKVVSLLEEHTDIIEKGGRKTRFGHKVCLNIGVAALI